jgi:uncharacterized protein
MAQVTPTACMNIIRARSIFGGICLDGQGGETLFPIRWIRENGFLPLFGRATMFVMHKAERVIATLRAHEEELRQAGLRSLSLFGSLARGETEMDSDIDLAAEFDPTARIDLLRLSAVERRIAELLGSPVDLLPEPVEKRRLQDQINRDRRRAF